MNSSFTWESPYRKRYHLWYKLIFCFHQNIDLVILSSGRQHVALGDFSLVTMSAGCFIHHLRKTPLTLILMEICHWLWLKVTCLFVYRYFFHPLRKYPGSLWAKLTDGYGGYHALWRNLHITTWKDHCKYGSVVRSGPNKLVFNSAQAVRGKCHIQSTIPYVLLIPNIWYTNFIQIDSRILIFSSLPQKLAQRYIYKEKQSKVRFWSKITSEEEENRLTW